MTRKLQKSPQLKGYVAHFSWHSDKLSGATNSRLTCFAVAESVERAAEEFADLLKAQPKDGPLDRGTDVYLDDISEVSIGEPMATTLFLASAPENLPAAALVATLGDDRVAHYSTEKEPDEEDLPKAVDTTPFVIVRQDGSVYRP